MTPTESLAAYWRNSIAPKPVYVVRAGGVVATWSTSRADAKKRAPEGAILTRETRP